MIAVLTSRFDEETHRAVAAWPGVGDVVSLTMDDLQRPGWVVPASDIAGSTFVARGQVLPASRLRGVINVLPGVYDFELLRIEKPDRAYVSAELFAFLVWWLNALPCPVFNRPSAGCLNGPAWTMQQWALACKRARIAVGQRERTARDDTAAIRSTIVVRGRSSGEVLGDESAVLATLAGTEFLEIIFERGERHDWEFRAVNMVPDLRRADVRAALEVAFA